MYWLSQMLSYVQILMNAPVTTVPVMNRPLALMKLEVSAVTATLGSLGMGSIVTVNRLLDHIY